MRNTLILHVTDEQLINEYLSGSNSALGELYRRYYNKVFYKCISFTKNTDDAFDLAQDILIKAFSNIGSFNGEAKFSTWLFSITYNHCISQLVKAKKIHFENLKTKYDLTDNSVVETVLSTVKEVLDTKIAEVEEQINFAA